MAHVSAPGSEQRELTTGAPDDNEKGVRRGIEQILSARPDFWNSWDVWYDPEADTVYFRRPGHGLAVAYFVPKEPNVVLNLDAETGELTGVDLEHFRRALSKKEPWTKLDRTLRPIPWWQRLHRRRSREARALFAEQVSSFLTPRPA
jgi:hypothetical protein